MTHNPTASVEQLEAHVQARLNGRVPDLRLLVRDQGLVLRGHAQQAVMEASRLRIVANEIEVT